VRFHLTRLDTEAAVYDTESGDTHGLTPLALAIWDLISLEGDTPSCRTLPVTAVLCEALRLQAEDAPHVEVALSQLQTIGLIPKA
jgi:PqqD family protein of HPr-rel-A system